MRGPPPGWTCVDDVREDRRPESMLRKPDASLLKTTGDVVTERLQPQCEDAVSRDGPARLGHFTIEYFRARASTMRPCFVISLSLRTETGFHENAVERVALDICYAADRRSSA